MPVVSVQSLPLEQDISVALPLLCESFSKAMDIDIHHVSVSWQFIQPGHYCVAGKCEAVHSPGFTLKVQLLTPNLYRLPAIERMLCFLANEVSTLAGIEVADVFVYHQEIASGHVFDEGKILHW